MLEKILVLLYICKMLICCFIRLRNIINLASKQFLMDNVLTRNLGPLYFTSILLLNGVVNYAFMIFF